MAISHIIYFFMYRNHYKGDCNRRQCIEHYYHLSTHAWIFPFFSCHDSKWRNKITIDCIKKKARESVLSLVPRFEAFALPFTTTASNNEAHADMLLRGCSPSTISILREPPQVFTYPANTECCFVSGSDQKLRSFESPKQNVKTFTKKIIRCKIRQIF